MRLIRAAIVLILPLFVLQQNSNAYADEDKTGIPFRVSALEELVVQQQDHIDELSKWVVVDSEKNVIGNVVSFTFRFNVVVVETALGDEDVLLWINSNGWIARTYVVVFEAENCVGSPYAQVPGGPWYKEVVIAVGPGQENSAVPYKFIGEVSNGPWMSHVEPNGECLNGFDDFPAALVEQLEDDLYVVHPRAPNPWSLERR